MIFFEAKNGFERIKNGDCLINNDIGFKQLSELYKIDQLSKSNQIMPGIHVVKICKGTINKSDNKYPVVFHLSNNLKEQINSNSIDDAIHNLKNTYIFHTLSIIAFFLAVIIQIVSDVKKAKTSKINIKIE